MPLQTSSLKPTMRHRDKNQRCIRHHSIYRHMHAIYITVVSDSGLDWLVLVSHHMGVF